MTGTARIGAVISTALCHEYLPLAMSYLRGNSREDTELALLVNGCRLTCEVHPRFTVISLAEYVPYLNGVWPRIYALAIERNWDWCVLVHDDMLLTEPGWEAALLQAQDRWHVGLAAWCTYDAIAIDGMWYALNGGPGLALIADGCALAFRMSAFRARGCFTDLDLDYGYGDAEASLWCLDQGLAVVNVGQPSHHFGSIARNRLRLGVGGMDTLIDRYRDLRPTRVILPNAVEYGMLRQTVDLSA